MQIRILIGAPREDTSTTGWADVSGKVYEDQWSLSRKVGSKINTLSLTLIDLDADTDIRRGHDIVIEDYNDSTKRLFGGIIAQISMTSLGIERDISLVVQDYTLLADRAVVRNSFIDTEDKDIILQCVQDSGRDNELDTSMVMAGRNIDSIEFNGVRLAGVMDQLVEITDYSWEVDPWKRLRYHPKQFIPGDFFFSDRADQSASFNYYNLLVSKNLAQWNSVALENATGISGDVTDVYANLEDVLVFTLGGQPGTSVMDREPSTANDTHPHLFIERNTGTNSNPAWTAQAVHIQGEPIGNVLWNPINRQITWSTAPPSIANSFRVTGRTLAPLRIINRDSEAIARHGREYAGSLLIPEATSLERAYDLGLSYLRDYSDKTTISFIHNQDGMDVGVVTKLNNSVLDLAEELIFVYEQTTTVLGGDVAEYQVSAELLDTYAIERRSTQP